MHLSAWIKDTNHFQFCVRVLGTDDNEYVIVYKPSRGSPYAGGGNYAWIPVGTQFQDGILRLRSGQARRHLDRDLEADLQAVYPTVGIQHVIRFGIRGDYDLDDLILYDENLSYLHADHLGSSSLATDAGGGVISEMRYYPYGETRTGELGTDRRYTGQRWESSVGLYDSNARYYDPYINQWTQPDTILPDSANPQSWNRYIYVLGNPLRYTDPTGHDPLDEQWQTEFELYHGRAPDGKDVVIRLYSIAYSDDWDWSAFYNPDGSYKAGSIEDILVNYGQKNHSWAGIPRALESMAGWYSDGEGRFLARDIGTLYGGLKDRLDASGWEAISHRDNPVQTWAYVGYEGLSPWLTGSSDADANIHHWAWGVAMGSEYGIGGSIINSGRELTQFSWDFENTWSDIAIGNAGASFGCSLRVLGPYDIRRQFNFHMMQWARR